MQATAIRDFYGVEDGKVYPRRFAIGDVVHGALAGEVVTAGWATAGVLSVKPTDVGPIETKSEPVDNDPALAKDSVDHAIPDDWRSMKWFALKALAEKISGAAVADAAKAKSVIEAALARRA